MSLGEGNGTNIVDGDGQDVRIAKVHSIIDVVEMVVIKSLVKVENFILWV